MGQTVPRPGHQGLPGVHQGRAWQPGPVPLLQTRMGQAGGTRRVPVLDIRHLPGNRDRRKPGWAIGQWIGVCIRSGEGTQGQTQPQDGQTGLWELTEARLQVSPQVGVTVWTKGVPSAQAQLKNRCNTAEMEAE